MATIKREYTQDDFRSIIHAVSKRYKLTQNKQYDMLIRAIDGDKTCAEQLDHRRVWLDFIHEKVYKPRCWEHCNSPAVYAMYFILDTPTLENTRSASYEDMCLELNAIFHDKLKLYLQQL